MRISDWSSDVCSSDLAEEQTKQGKDDADFVDGRGGAGLGGIGRDARVGGGTARRGCKTDAVADCDLPGFARPSRTQLHGVALGGHPPYRKNLVSGQMVSVRVDLGGILLIKKQIK